MLAVLVESAGGDRLAEHLMTYLVNVSGDNVELWSPGSSPLLNVSSKEISPLMLLFLLLFLVLVLGDPNT